MTTATQPSEKVLSFMIEYFRALADKQHRSLKRTYGIVEFMYKDIEEFTRTTNGVERIVGKTEIVNIMKWLREKGYAKRLQVGKHKNPSVWDVRNLLEEPPVEGEPDSFEFDEDNDIPTYANPNIQVRLVDKVQEPEEKETYNVERYVEKPDNKVVLAQINESINDMIGYLQTLPIEMMTELKNLTRDLEYADPNLVLKMTKEKEDLKEQVSQLKEELGRASAAPDYNEHYIYRQRNLVLDEVQRMLHAPAWSVRQNKEHYTNSIVEKLDNIMDHLGIKEE